MRCPTRVVVERLSIRPRQSGGSRAGRGPALGLSLLHGFWDDRCWIGVKVALILTLLILVALLEVP